jgi:acyl-CoA oxidase
VHDLSKDELRERTMEKIAEMRHYVKTEDSKTFARRCQVSRFACATLGGRWDRWS